MCHGVWPSKESPPFLKTPLCPALQFAAINWITVFRSCFLVMFVAYPGVSLKVMRLFQCRTIDGVSYLEADMLLKVGSCPTSPRLLGLMCRPL